MHWSNVRLGPIIPYMKLTYLSEGDKHGNNNWRDGLYLCIANRNLFIRVLAKGRVDDGEF